MFIGAEIVNDGYVLRVIDDGVGMPENVNVAEISNMGFLLVFNLVDQLEGKVNILNSTTGFAMEIFFPN